MRYKPKDWDTYTLQQREEWYQKPYEETRKIILQSYMSTIADENGNLDEYKLLEIIIDLQDRVDELENTCERNDSYYD
jgi:hypothetical protein